MLNLIGLSPKGGGKDIAILVRIRKYNEAVPRLNAMLRSGQVKDFLLPEERPDLAKRLGLGLL